MLVEQSLTLSLTLRSYVARYLARSFARAKSFVGRGGTLVESLPFD